MKVSGKRQWTTGPGSPIGVPAQDMGIPVQGDPGRDEHSTVVSLFNNESWAKLWDELGVTEPRWQALQKSQSANCDRSSIPLRLNFGRIDEGSLTFESPAALPAECRRARRFVTNPEASGMLDDLASAMESAVVQHHVVHIQAAASGERVGDKFATKVHEKE